MSRSILKISGSDRETFLQGMVTNDVARLQEGLVYAALLSPQGKYLADFFLVPAKDAILLDADGEQAAGLAQRLGMYKLRADVSIEIADLHVHRGLENCPEDGFPDPRDPRLGWRAYRDAPAQTDNVNWDAIRVEALVPEAGSELFPNDSYILEMGFERLNGVDFKKGCYVGQEVTARMKHKTELRKGLARVEIDGDAPAGTEIQANGKTVGTLLTRSENSALAYLRYDRALGVMSALDAKVIRKQ